MLVTQKDIENFNLLYYKCKNYSQVARETGFSASTVRKYVKKDYIPEIEIKKEIFDVATIPQKVDIEMFKKHSNWGELLILSEEEKGEIEELWKEMNF